MRTIRKNRLLPFDVVFDYSGGAYIDISVNYNDGCGTSNAVNVINVYDYAKGESRVKTEEEFRACATEHMNDIEWLADLRDCVKYTRLR